MTAAPETLVHNAIELAQRLTQLTQNRTSEQVRGALTDEQRNTILDELDHYLDALTELADANPQLADDIEPLGHKLTELQLFLSGG